MTFLSQLAHYLTFRFLLQGMVTTLVIAVGSLVGSILLGAGLAALQMSKTKLLSLPARIYSATFRGTPLILQLVFFYDALPHIHITLSAIVTAVVVFSLNEATFFAEIFRGGVVSVDRGQIAAAESFGMTPSQIMHHVIGPQALRTILPMLGNQTVGLIKNTSLASVISANELTLRSESLVAQNFTFFPVFFASGIMYLFLTSAVAAAQALAEWRLNLDDVGRRSFISLGRKWTRAFRSTDDQLSFEDAAVHATSNEFTKAEHRRNSMRSLAGLRTSTGTEENSGGANRAQGPDSENLVQIKNVSKAFGGKVVLSDVSFNVAAGEVVVLMGASGSGKSTLLRLVNHLEKIDSGEILVGGLRVGYLEDGQAVAARLVARARAEARLAMVFQHFELFSHKTALENVALAPVVVHERSESDALPQARALLGAVGLAERQDYLPARLSGGQQQRVAIARALAVRPSLVLFDEPTSALDPELVGEVLEIMRELAESGMTMLVVTHEVRFAREVADRVVFMADGHIVEQGPTAQVLETPSDPRTRRFLRLLEEPEEAAIELLEEGVPT